MEAKRETLETSFPVGKFLSSRLFGEEREREREKSGKKKENVRPRIVSLIYLIFPFELNNLKVKKKKEQKKVWKRKKKISADSKFFFNGVFLQEHKTPGKLFAVNFFVST